MSSDSTDRPPPSKRRTTKLSTLLYQDLPKEASLSAEERKTLRHFAAKLTKNVARRPFVCLVTNDSSLRQLNLSFRGRDYATDVLSFPSTGDNLGDIAISIERANAQAGQFGHSCREEIQILMLHGVLHLTGMDHETDEGAMALAEERWRKELNLSASLIGRSAVPENVG